MEEGADAIVEYFPQESKVSIGIDIGTVFWLRVAGCNAHL